MDQVIELTQEVKPLRWRWRILRGLLILAALLVASHYYARAFIELQERVKEQIETTRVKALQALKLQDAEASAARRDESMKDLITRIAKEHSISPVLVLAMAHRESGAGLRPDRLRYEDHIAKRHKLPDTTEGRMGATSIGLMQVIPVLHVGKGKTCEGIADSYGALFNAERNVRCGIAVLKACLQRSGGSFRQSLKCYNGSDEYAQAIMSNLGEFAIKEFHLLETTN